MTGDTLKGPETIDWRQYSSYCVHGVQIYYICPKCVETARQEAREARLYETLDKLADAVAALGLALWLPRGPRAPQEPKAPRSATNEPS